MVLTLVVVYACGFFYFLGSFHDDHKTRDELRNEGRSALYTDIIMVSAALTWPFWTVVWVSGFLPRLLRFMDKH